MEDSGFDSGEIRTSDVIDTTPIEVHVITATSKQPLLESSDERRHPGNESNGRTTRSTTAQLQKRMERRIEQAKKSHIANGTIDQQPRKNLISINRLHVPGKTSALLSDGAERPLVSWESDSSEDEFEINPTSSLTRRHDDFDLDQIPDDEEELDLIPPQPLNQRCTCCAISKTMCNVQ
ncbi:hypothetical protein CHUAL_011047 [Chamberlinius hualienensis]